MQTQPNQVILFLIISTSAILLLVGLIVVLIFLYQKKQLAYQQKLDTMRLDYEKNLLSTQVEIQEDVFQHVSREIHDNISLSLTLAKLSLNTLDWQNLARASLQINSSLEQISKAINDLSDISKSLNSELISNQGLIIALEQEMAKMNEMNLFELNYLVTGTPVFMDSQKELIIFRIIQEAFNNIIKHARATAVEVMLNYTGDRVEVSISDNGRGFCDKEAELNSDKKSRAGLNNMKKRALIFNGNTLIKSEPDIGTKVFVTIPY